MNSSGMATAVAHAVAKADEALVSVARNVKTEPTTHCEVCGKICEMPMEIGFRGRVGSFDCFECAIHAMAPTCEHCGCRIIGHDVEEAGKTYCCAHCAHAAQERG